MAWSPDGTRIATGGYDDGVRVWDAATGRPVLATIALLPDSEIAQFDAAMTTLTGATPGAWRWLGWPTTENGRMSRLPAETYGPLPPLRRSAPHDPVKVSAHLRRCDDGLEEVSAP